jgi:hypothetical protein
MSCCDEVYRPAKFARDKSEEFARQHPHHHQSFLSRPDVTRRRFFRVSGAGLVGSYLAATGVRRAAAAETVAGGVTTKNTAKNAIFVFLNGAISQMDTFDLKVTSDTPAALTPTMINGINWPAGLLPKLGGQLADVAIVRSMSAWALVHSLAQTWTMIGRNPVAALGDIAPNIGSVVAIEKDGERQPGQIFPAFVALNTPSGPGSGYFPAGYGPFRVNQRAGTASAGVTNTSNVAAASMAAFDPMYNRLREYDGTYRVNSPYGPELQDYDSFYAAAKGLMYNPVVQQAFNISTADSQRYGATQFGNACLVAKQVLAANQGTRFIQIQLGGWDMHQNIYDTGAQGIFALSTTLDNGLSALLGDLKSAGMLSETLVVVLGEFGRTPRLSAAAGRDHYLLQSALLAGGGVKGGKIIGATNADGSAVTEFGWNGSGNSGPRYVRPEDMEATILSALGIDWTKVRYDDPYGRGFEYVPFAADGAYGPVHELWG